MQIIAPDAFEDMGELEEITLPKNLVKLERNLFGGCDKLKKIFYNGSKEEWNKLPKNRHWNASSDKDVEIVYLR